MFYPVFNVLSRVLEGQGRQAGSDLILLQGRVLLN
jgi:hypothetical protein